MKILARWAGKIQGQCGCGCRCAPELANRVKPNRDGFDPALEILGGFPAGGLAYIDVVKGAKRGAEAIAQTVVRNSRFKR